MKTVTVHTSVAVRTCVALPTDINDNMKAKVAADKPGELVYNSVKLVRILYRPCMCACVRRTSKQNGVLFGRRVLYD